MVHGLKFLLSLSWDLKRKKNNIQPVRQGSCTVLKQFAPYCWRCEHEGEKKRVG